MYLNCNYLTVVARRDIWLLVCQSYNSAILSFGGFLDGLTRGLKSSMSTLQQQNDNGEF